MEELEIIVEGTSKIHDIEIPNIYGGFGSDKKAIADKTIAELHNIKEVKIVRQNIKNNIKQFEKGIDYIDLKQVNLNDLFLNLGYTKAQWGNSKNIYLLSERGYMKLIKIMDTQLAWGIYNEMLNDYFYYREKEEFTFEAEAVDRMINGFNYKEIEKFIDDNPEGIVNFKLQDLSEWVPSGKYPKSLIKAVLETTDNEINKTLKDRQEKPVAIKTGTKIKQFLEENAIPYSEGSGKLIIYDKSYSKSSITFYSEEEVITIVLTLQNNKITEHIRKELLKQGFIHIIPINNVTLTEKEKELTAKCEELEDTISDLKKELKASRKATESLNSTIQNLEKEKQDAYKAGIEEGKKQAKKEKGKNLFNNIKDSVKKAKKWIKNKRGGDKPQAEIKEYPNTNSNRIKPESNPETEKIGRFTNIEESEDDKKNRLRKEVGILVHRVANLKSKQVKIIWNNLHYIISNKFRNGNYIGKSRNLNNPNLKPSVINSYTLEELEFAIEYLTEIINKKAIG